MPTQATVTTVVSPYIHARRNYHFSSWYVIWSYYIHILTASGTKIKNAGKILRLFLTFLRPSSQEIQEYGFCAFQTIIKIQNTDFEWY
jgi:hypothetical protein